MACVAAPCPVKLIGWQAESAWMEFGFLAACMAALASQPSALQGCPEQPLSTALPPRQESKRGFLKVAGAQWLASAALNL